MKLSVLLMGSFLLCNSVQADPLSSADREALLDSLQQLHDEAEGKVDAKFRVALTAFKNACASDDAAVELYLNCTERVNFDDKNKKAADFREWKRKESDRLAAPATRMALRLQLRWLVLTLLAAPEKADRAKLAVEAQQVLDAIFSAPAKFADQQDLLGQSVLSTVFAKAYEITHVKVDKWPQSPIQLDQIYEQLVMPPLRTPSQVAGLRSAWINRIQQEGAKVEFWASNRGGGEKKGSQDAPSTAFTKFTEEARPKLQWEMEIDLFRAGDEKGAASRMLAHLGKHISHLSAKDWSNELKQLLEPVATPAPAAGAP